MFSPLRCETVVPGEHHVLSAHQHFQDDASAKEGVSELLRRQTQASWKPTSQNRAMTYLTQQGLYKELDPTLGIHVCIAAKGVLPPISLGIPIGQHRSIEATFHRHIHLERIRPRLWSLAVATFRQSLRIQRWCLFHFPKAQWASRMCSAIQCIAYWVWRKTYAE